MSIHQKSIVSSFEPTIPAGIPHLSEEYKTHNETNRVPVGRKPRHGEEALAGEAVGVTVVELGGVYIYLVTRYGGPRLVKPFFV